MILLLMAAAAGLTLALFIARAPSARASQRRAADLGVSLSLRTQFFHSLVLRSAFTGVASTVTANLEYGPTTSYGSTCCSVSFSPGDLSPEFGPSGLQPGTLYHFRVSAQMDGTTYHSDDFVATTPATGPPEIRLDNTTPADVFQDNGYPSASPCWNGPVEVNTKGFDTTWSATAGPDLSHPLTYTWHLVIPALDSDDYLHGGGVGGFTICLDSSTWPAGTYPGELLYLQLHASNAAGDTNGPIWTYTLPTATTATTTAATTTAATTTTSPGTPTTTSTPTTTAATTTQARTTTALPPKPPPKLGKTVFLKKRTRSHGCTRGALPDRRCSPGTYFKGLTKAILCSQTFRTGSIRNVPNQRRTQSSASTG